MLSATSPNRSSLVRRASIARLRWRANSVMPQIPAIQKARLMMGNRNGQLNDEGAPSEAKNVRAKPMIVRAVHPMATTYTILRGKRWVAKNTTPVYNISSANPRGSRRSNVKTPPARIRVKIKSFGLYNLLEYIRRKTRSPHSLTMSVNA